MGFFFPDDSPLIKPITKRAIVKAPKVFDPNAVGCDHCPMQVVWPRLTSPRMAFSGNAKDGDILVMGAAPDLNSDKAGEYFAGPDWKLFHKQIPGAFFDRLIFGAMTRCARPAGGPVTAGEAHCCSTYLEDELDLASVAGRPIIAILGVGQEVLSRYFPGTAMQRVHGTWINIEIGGRAVWFYPVMDPSYLLASNGKFSRGGPESSPAFPVFHSDIKRFFKSVDNKGKAHIHHDLKERSLVQLPKTYDEARNMLAALKPAPENQPAIDLETDNLRPYNVGATIYAASIATRKGAIAFPVDWPQAGTDWGFRLLLEVAEEYQWLAHNAAFEYMWLKFMANAKGFEFRPQPFDDSMASARLYHARETLIGLDLLSAAHLGVNIKRVVNLDAVRILEYPMEDGLWYCGLDSIACARIQAKLRFFVNGDNYKRLVEGAQSTSDMALLGLDVDFEAARELKEVWQAKMQEAEEGSRQLYEVRRYEKERGRFELSSADQVGTALTEYGKLDLPKTASGKFSTDDESLRHAMGEVENPLVIAVLDYREAAKMISTYIEPVLTAPARTYDGRLHPGYTVMMTRTLRLSSEDPNIQNWPSRKHKELRRQVRAKPGHLLVKFDYKALEARVIGMASKDKALCASIIKGIDIHSRWRDAALEIYPAYIDRLAEKTNQTDHAKILKGGRDIIKTDFVFASFFGSSAESCSKRTGMPLEYTRELSAEFWREFYGVKAWIKARRQEYQDTGSIKTLTGIERRGIMAGNEPINTPIQGVGANIVVEAMNDIAKLARDRGDMYLHPRINIHDDLTFELPDDDRITGYIDEIAAELVKVRFDWQIIPLAVEAAIGDTWATLEEFASFTGEYVR